MKRFLVLLLLVPACMAAQVQRFYGHNYVSFTLQHPIDSMKIKDVDWEHETRLVSEFELKGKTIQKYSIKLLDEDQARLSQYINGQWMVLETFEYDPWLFYGSGGNTLLSSFEITDFDKDGNEDLVCVVASNVHGCLWTVIYLNEPKKNTLAKLWEPTDESYIWDAPEYDKKTKAIYCERPGGVFDVRFTSVYRLLGHTAIPLYKDEQDTNDGRYHFDSQYTGNLTKWQRNNILTYMPLAANDSSFLYYAVSIENDTTATLLHYNAYFDEADTIYKEKLDYADWDITLLTNEVIMDMFTVTDFNNDGNDDVLYRTSTNVYGNTFTVIYLSDPLQHKLVKLYNTAESSDLWVNPEYDKNKKVIRCKQLSGNVGIMYTSTYNLEGLVAVPLKKHEEDRTQVNGMTGKGYVEIEYKGSNGQWKLINTLKDE